MGLEELFQIDLDGNVEMVLNPDPEARVRQIADAITVLDDIKFPPEVEARILAQLWTWEADALRATKRYDDARVALRQAGAFGAPNEELGLISERIDLEQKGIVRVGIWTEPADGMPES
jgi:hypothetical protein